MSKRKILALLLAVAMICSLCVPALAAEGEGEPVAISDNAGPKFTDLDGHWAEKAIYRWADYGIVRGDGDGTVNPARSLKRAELATVLTRLLGLKGKSPAGLFSDVSADAWYADAVLKCAKAGIMLGDGAGHANPEAPIDRQQTIVMVARALGVKPASTANLSKFADANKVADWAAPYMTVLVELDILHGIPYEAEGEVRLDPTEDINRASTFTLLDKAIAQYVTTPTTVTANDANKFVVINAAAGEDVTVTGKTAGIVVGAGSTDDVVLDNATVGTLKVDAPVNVTIKKGSTVTDLDANAAIDVTNNGTVTNLNTNADDVTFDGNKPAAVNTAEGVKPATDSKGKEVTAAQTTVSGGSSSGSTVKRADLVAAPLHDNAEAGKALADEDLGKVTVTNRQNGTVDGAPKYDVTVTGRDIMNHTNANSANRDGHWVGFGMPAKVNAEGETGTYTYLVDGTEVPTIASRTYEVNGKTYNTVYFSNASESFDDTVVTVKDGDTVVATYNVTFDVTFKSDYKTSVLAAVEQATLDKYAATPIAHKFADGLGLTATVSGTTIKLSGETTIEKLRNTHLGTTESDGYLLFGVNVGDKNIAKAMNTALEDELSSGLENALLLNLKIYDHNTKALLNTSAELVLADKADREQGKVTVTVDATDVTIEGMKKVTFMDGDKVVKTVVDTAGQTVTAPTMTNADDAEVYYTNKWKDSTGAYVGTFTVGDADAVYTAEKLTITPTKLSVREDGPEGFHGELVENFAYGEAYEKAGLKLEGSKIVVNAAALIDMVNSTDEAVQDQLLHIKGHEGKKDEVTFGVAYGTSAANATKLAYAGTVAGLDSATVIDLASHPSCYNGTLISYISVAAIGEGNVVTFLSQGDSDYVKWMDKDGNVVDVTKTVITLETTEVPSSTVTFDSDGGSAVGAQTVAYNGKADEPTAPTKEGYTFLGWFAKDSATAFDFTTVIKGDMTLTAKWEKAPETLKVTAYDYSSDGTNQYITYTLTTADGETFYIAASTVKECWYRNDRKVDGEWKKDEGVTLFSKDIAVEANFEGMDKAHQLGWTVARRAEDTTAYWRFVTTDGTVYEAEFAVPAKINTTATWPDTEVKSADELVKVPGADNSQGDSTND